MSYVELEVMVINSTDKAILVEIEEEDHWIPLSQIEDNGDDFENGYEGPMFVSEWFANKEGLV